MTRQIIRLSICVSLLIVMLSSSAPYGVASNALTDGIITRISVASNGTQGNNDSYGYLSISADGRYVVYSSSASNLIDGDTNNAWDIFVHDGQTGITKRVSVDSIGVQGNGGSGDPAISSDGQFVAFHSVASNLVSGDTNGTSDVFVYDQQTRITELISSNPNGTPGDGSSGNPSISADGRYVAFTSSASNLVFGDTNGAMDVFVHDQQTGVTQRISLDSDGNQANNHSSSNNTSLSPDGRYVAFQSVADNLASGDDNNAFDIFVYDRRMDIIQRISLSSEGAQGDYDSIMPSISADGRFVAFASNASNLVNDDTNGRTDVFVRDLQTGVTQRVSIASDGTQANENSNDGSTSISADGRYIAFDSYASNLVNGDTNGTKDVFIHDRLTSTTHRISLSSEGIQGNGQSWSTAINVDGRYIAFQSYASNLITGDSNGYSDIFVYTALSNGTVQAGFSAAPSSGPAPLTVTFINQTKGDYQNCYWEFGDRGTSTACNPFYTYTAIGVYTVTLTASGLGGTDTLTQTHAITVYTPVQAGFTISPTRGAAPLSVTFTNTSNGDFTDNLWDFGDGLSSQAASPTHTYTTPGFYTVTLTASGPGGVDTLSLTNAITVYNPVCAGFIAAPTFGVAPLNVAFTNNSSGDFAESQWDFGDGLSSQADSPTHTYTTPGFYTVTLTASGLGGTDTLQRPAYISVDEFATWRVSLSSDGDQGNSDSQLPAISTGGRYTAFSSSASSLVAGDTNGVQDIFVHDRQSGLTQRVSLASGGAQGNSSSQFPSISADGRYVAFASQANNLVTGDTNNASDVFVHDRQAGDTRRVSLDSDGNQANGGSGLWNVSISADGRYVSFDSAASNLTPGDTNGVSDVFVHDLQTGANWRVSIHSNGTQGDGNSQFSVLSADGRFVAFESDSSNLVADDNNGAWDVFVHDRQTGTTQRASLASDGSQGNGYSTNPAISADGRYVAFDSLASNLVAGDTNNVRDVFVRDLQAGLTRRVSLAPDGSQGNSGSGLWRLAISADGRYVAFASNASNLVADDDNNVGDIFVHVWNTGDTLRVSTSPGGIQANGASANPSISPDGCYIAYDSSASNLVTGDTNGARDIFVSPNPAYAPLQASFSAEPTEGHAPLTVAFTNQTGGFFTSSLWDFGDGITSTLIAPTHTYTIPGAYTVTLTASGLNGTSTRQKPAYIHVDGQIIWRMSVASDGTQADDSSWNPSLSADGGLVAFESDATNLTDWDINKAGDVFVHILQTGVTQRASLASDGTQGESASSEPIISANGRFVVFSSNASNLVAGDTNGALDVFVRDRQSGVTGRVSLASDGTQGNANSGGATISADGRYVAFSSIASNLVAGDTNGNWDVFVHDRQTGLAQRVSTASDGAQGNALSAEASISADGRYVAFASYASNLVSDDTNEKQDVFIYDRQAGVTQRISLASDGTQGNHDSYRPSISADGRYVAFESAANNLVTDDTNQHRDVFVRDRQLNLTQRISITSDGSQSNGYSGDPSISGDGRYVAFYSEASNLVTGDTNGQEDVFVHALWTGETQCISEAADGTPGNGNSYNPSISADGKLITYGSSASNLVPVDTNNLADIYLSANPTYTPVQAFFTIEPRQGPAPLTVTFTNQTIGEFTTSLWDFGDGFTSIMTSPTHTYIAPGVYTVTLTASGPHGTNTLILTHAITVYAPVQVAFSPEPASGLVPLTVSFTNQTTGDYTACSWDFGDGVSSNEGNPQHTYTAPGSYTVTLTADGPGGWDRLEHTNAITVYNVVQADFSAMPTVGTSPLAVTFTNQTTGDFANILWNFGDGITSTLLALTHTYTTPGSYTVTLTASGPGGTDTINQINAITVYIPVSASFSTEPTTGITPLSVLFTNHTTGENLNYSWDFGDGGSSNEQDPQHTYTTPGSYTVTLTADGLGGWDQSESRNAVIVYGPVQASFSAAPTAGLAPLTVAFTNQTTGGVTNTQWTFGDGITSTLVAPTHTYTIPGIYTVTLTTSGPGGTDVEQKPALITAYRQTVWRSSVGISNSQVNSDSYGPSISADGRFVAFTSEASNLVTEDTNGQRDVFVHDWQTDVTERVSLTSDGKEGNGGSFSNSISNNGRWIAFVSDADNLVAGDTNHEKDIFVHDRQTGVTHRVSVASDGVQGNNASFAPSISGDGRYVAFASYASNLVISDTNQVGDVFIHDRQTSLTRRVSVSSSGAEGRWSSENPSISTDGRFVSFYSWADNLVSGDTNGILDVFVHDLQTGETRRVSISSGGNQGNGDSGYRGLSISADGRYVAFSSDATNLVPSDTNKTDDVFIHDRQSGITQRVSISSNGIEGNWQSKFPSISADGRFVAFMSAANNLVAGDTEEQIDIFVHDRQTGITRRVSQVCEGIEANGASQYPSISANGVYVAFESYSNNLVNGDTNNIRDIFIQGPTAYTPLQAGFSASPTSGVAPLLVTFTNQTNGYFTAILWDFGDAITSTLMSPTHTFAAPGIYTITLTATGPGGMDTLTWPGYIDVHRPLSLYLPLVQRK